jgi:AcrR family transcriptional regulator
MRTGRPRGFCTDTALDRAMNVFWRKGYEGASLSDLTEAMGINPPSLYSAFGNKEGLFRAVLERYDSRRKGFMEQVLTAPSAEAVARGFLEGVAEFAVDTSGLNPPGCLLVQSGQSCSDTMIPEKEGDLPESANPETLARYLSAIANGICMQAAAGAGAKELLDIAQLALASWPKSAKAKKGKRTLANVS